MRIRIRCRLDWVDKKVEASKKIFCKLLIEISILIHRDSERQLHFDTKFEHEEMVLVA